MRSWLKSKKWAILNALVLAVMLTVLGVQVADKPASKGIPIGNWFGGEKVITLGPASVFAAGSVDYTFDGVADNVQFQAALNALPATGGRLVIVSATTIVFAATVTRAIDNVTIEGAGRGTYFTYDAINPIFTAGGNNWKFINIRTDAGSLSMGATTGWEWNNVTIAATYYAYRTPVASTTAASWEIPTGRTATLTVCSSMALYTTQCDYVADGTADQAQIQAAIDAAPASGAVVRLSEGDFNITDGVSILVDNITLEGSTGTRVLSSANNIGDIVAVGAVGTAVSGVVVRGFEIDMNNAAYPGASATIANGTGTVTGSPVTLLGGVESTPTITVAGTFTVTLPAGGSGYAITGGWPVVGSPVLLIAGANVITVGAGGPGTITIAITGKATGVNLVNAQWSTVDSMIIHHAPDLGEGINLEAASTNITISNNRIYDLGVITTAYGTDPISDSDGIETEGNYVVLLNNTIERPKNDCIDLDAGHNLLVLGNTLTDCYESYIENNSLYNLRVEGNTLTDTGLTTADFFIHNNSGFNANYGYGVISNNVITGANNAPGIRIYTSKDLTIANNAIYRTNVGIYLESVGGSRNHNIAILGNVISDTYSEGMNITASDNNVLVDGNSVKRSGKGVANKSAIMLGSGTQAVTISNNSLTDDQGVPTQEAGINATSASHLTITGNIIEYNKRWGIYGSGLTYSIISANIIRNNSMGAANSDCGIYLRDTATNNIITGNVARDTRAGGARTQSGGVCLRASDEASNIITDNDVTNNITAGIETSLGGATQAYNNVFQNNTGTIVPGEVRVARGTLTAGLANAIAFAWHNPEAQDILVKKVVVEITTGSVTVGSEIDIGIADDAAGTNLGTEFFNNLDANDVDINDSWVVGDGGTQTKWVFAQDSASATDGWVVGQILTADAAALVGRYYIDYVGR